MDINQFKTMMYTPGQGFVIFTDWYVATMEDIVFMLEQMTMVLKQFGYKGSIKLHADIKYRPEDLGDKWVNTGNSFNKVPKDRR